MYTLIITAIVTAAIHTISGPDHYLPLIALGRSNQWTLGKTAWVTLLAGALHIGATIIFGLLVILLGIQMGLVETISSIRGDVTAWFFVIFGTAYTVWGIFHSRSHDGKTAHSHGWIPKFLRPKPNGPQASKATQVILLLLFTLGPVEPLIPLLMLPAAQYGVMASLSVGLVYALATIVTMGFLVGVGFLGLKNLPRSLMKYSHALSGFVVLGSGIAMLFGW